MKIKQLIFLLLFFTSIQAFAQVWPTMSSTWHYDMKSFDQSNPKFDKYNWTDEIFYVNDIDTILGVPMLDIYLNGLHKVHIGRSSNVLYYYDVLHAEIDTILDYNASVGSSWQLTNTIGTDETITVNSISTILVNGISRRQYVLNFSTLSNQVFVEDVGFESYILPSINYCYYSGTSTDCFAFLTKYTDDVVLEYIRKTPFPYSCSYHLKQDTTYFDPDFIQCNDSNYVIDLNNAIFVYWFDGSLEKKRFFNHTEDISCLIEFDGCIGPSDTMHIIPKKHILEPMITNAENFHCDSSTPVTLYFDYNQYPPSAVQYYWLKNMNYVIDVNVDSLTIDTIATYNVMISDTYLCSVFSDPYYYKVKPIELNKTLFSTDCITNVYQLHPGLPVDVVIDSFYWNIPDNDFNPYVGSWGTFEIVVVDTGSCLYIGNHTIGTEDIYYQFQYPEIGFATDPSALCNSTTVELYSNKPNSNWYLDGTNIAVNQDTITASAVGNYWCTYLDSLGCASISQDTLHISSINLTPTMYIDTLASGQIILVAEPTGPDFYYQWYLDGNPIAVGALNDTLYPVTSGVYECWVTDLLCGDYSNNSNVIISDLEEWASGIEIYQTIESLQVIGNSRIEGLNVSLVQLDGKVLFQEKAAGQETLIPITHLAQGMYILVLQDIESKRISTQKIILQR